jgi:putative sterol carrier protein
MRSAVPKFPSEAWAEAFRVEINQSPAYAEAARAWEGDFLLLVLPDARAPKGEGIYLDLFHGTCRAARYVSDPGSVSPEYVYEGKREHWARLMRREIEPVRSLLGGTFRLRGNLLKAARFQRAAKEMVEAGIRVPTEMD